MDLLKKKRCRTKEGSIQRISIVPWPLAMNRGGELALESAKWTKVGSQPQTLKLAHEYMKFPIAMKNTSFPGVIYVLQCLSGAPPGAQCIDYP